MEFEPKSKKELQESYLEVVQFAKKAVKSLKSRGVDVRTDKKLINQILGVPLVGAPNILVQDSDQGDDLEPETTQRDSVQQSDDQQNQTEQDDH